ncbi:MAG: branched-chain amino acid ABC transporter permease [Alphaproteobacteria bacterium]|nr:branched-chain amino acid ABC transporter permease [Alphaproteobacteria bacterium]
MRRAVLLGGLALLILLPPLASWAAQPFYLTLVTRMLIFAIAALSLDLILGYGAMVSFGHAAYLGIGAYAVGILGYHGVTEAWIQWPVAIVGSAAVAALIGLVSLRTSGVYFIMITLAFAQMLYFLAISLKTYGGDDGLTIQLRSRLGPIDLADNVVLYYVVLAVLLGFLLVGARLVESRFGMVIRGAKSNERRLRALGFPTVRYRLVAFVIAGAMCGTAGVLLANLTNFTSPAYMHWTRSGELMVMVILGGLASLIGPILGAFALLALEEALSSWTQHWQVILGPILVLIVLFAKGGLYGLLPSPPRDHG